MARDGEPPNDGDAFDPDATQAYRPEGMKPSGADDPTGKISGPPPPPPKERPGALTGPVTGPVAGAGAGAAGAAGKGTGKVPAKRKKSKHRVQKVLWSLVGIGVIMFGMLAVAYARTDIPAPNESALRQTSRAMFADGKTEIGRFGDTNRSIVGIDQMPEHLRDAVLAAENRSFYTDNGVSPRGIARAVWVNLRGGQTQGGSTITQQYVKNYYLTQERTIKRKFKEALLSIKIDKVLSKDQILENYLNTIYMGRSAYGVQAAAKAYYAKDAKALSVSESIALAGLIQSPGRYEPSDSDSLKSLKKRWTFVANAMVKTGTLTQPARDKLKFPKFPKDIASQSKYGEQRGYILNAIRKELLDRGVEPDMIENGGLQIITTLDEQAQKSAVAAVKKEFPKTKNGGLRVGLVAVQPKTGNVLAMYGGKDFLGKDKYAQVNTATTPIQPGSSMKPFAVAAALENGFDLQSRFSGKSPFKVPGGQVNNEFDQSYGKSEEPKFTVDLRYGLADSINTVFVDLATQVGPEKIREIMVKAGIPEKAPGLIDSALIPLGIASIRPIEVANAYATLCGEGIYAPRHMVDRVLRANGGELSGLDKIEISKKPILDRAVVSDTIRAMQAVVNNGTGTRARALNRPVAGKTGTHQDLTAWFTGCTPQIAASVDYFKGDGTKSLDGSAGMSTFFGGTYPAQTWTTFMQGALKGKPIEQFALGKGVTATISPTPTEEPTEEPTVGPTATQEPTIPPFIPVPTFPTFPTFTPNPTPKPTVTVVPTEPPVTPEPTEPPETEEPDPDEDPEQAPDDGTAD